MLKLWVFDERVNSHKRPFRHCAHPHSLSSPDDKIVDVSSRLGVDHYVVASVKIGVRGVIDSAFSVFCGDIKRFASVTGIRFGHFDSDFVFFLKGASHDALRFLHREIYDSGQYGVASASGTNVGG